MWKLIHSTTNVLGYFVDSEFLIVFRNKGFIDCLDINDIIAEPKWKVINSDYGKLVREKEILYSSTTKGKVSLYNIQTGDELTSILPNYKRFRFVRLGNEIEDYFNKIVKLIKLRSKCLLKAFLNKLNM